VGPQKLVKEHLLELLISKKQTKVTFLIKFEKSFLNLLVKNKLDLYKSSK
jgi:hypothetical protein